MSNILPAKDSIKPLNKIGLIMMINIISFVHLIFNIEYV